MYLDSKRRPNRFSGSALSVLRTTLALVFALVLGPLAASAAVMAPANQAQPQSLAPITVPAGGTATLNVRGFCLDFGKPFPTDNMTTNGLAQDNIRAALQYSIQKGYTEGNPAQVELAIWNLRDGTWHNSDNAIAQEIVTNATSANTPPSTPSAGSNGMSLDDAVKQNKVSLQATFVAQTAGHFYGDATIQIKNSGNADLQIYMPVGTMFTVPNGGGKFQDLAAYTLNNQSAQPAATSSEPAATGTVSMTTTATVASTETVAATAPTTSTEVATTTEVATGTAAVSGTATMAESPTAMATSAVESPTVEATSTVAVAPTSTTAPTEQATPTAMATPVVAPLPQTGDPGGPGAGLIAAIALAALMLVALGLALRQQRARQNVTKR